MSARLRFVALAILVEGGLGALALGLGWVLEIAPFAGARPEPLALLLGVLATLPPLILLRVGLRASWDALARLRDVLVRVLEPLARHGRPVDLVLISAAAGIGEEALFRGLLQGGLVPVTGSAGALVLASLAFGLAHALTLGYAVFATLMGAYLGLMQLWSGNLWVPIVIHGLYDAVALRWLLDGVARTRG